MTDVSAATDFTNTTEPPVLHVEHLDVSFASGGHSVSVLSDVSFSIGANEIVGLVGESGSGKSVTCMATLGLLPERTAVVKSDVLRLGDVDLTALSTRQLEDVRGSEVGYVFQDPVASLNPTFTVGDQITEVLRRHRGTSRREARRIAVDMLTRVGIPDPVSRLKNYPHEMSGGMCQRVMIAMALACEPRLLIADEPTTALDVTVQAQIIELLRELAGEGQMSVLLVTHDLGLVAELCDRVIVMYAGQIIEEGSAVETFHNPKHPYTAALIRSAPRLGSGSLFSIPGSVPVAGQFPAGCRFAPRCELAGDECRDGAIHLAPVALRHLARCLHHDEVTA